MKNPPTRPLYGMRLRQFIAQGARQRGLDPKAVLAVVQSEGGYHGATGDQGTSFGPFQLHRGGALPGHIRNPEQWANMPGGLNYALNAIAPIARDQQGIGAITNIVRRFERPADPAAEIKRASGYYGGLDVPSGQPIEKAGYGGSGSPHSDPQAVLQALSLMNQGPEGFGSFLAALGGLKASQSQDMSQNKVGNAATFSNDLFGGVKGTQIGYPYTGTHTLGNWQSDRAIDVRVPKGTPLYAPFSGTVSNPGGSVDEGSRFGGFKFTLEGDSEDLWFGHLSRLAPWIKPGAHIKAGQRIGRSGVASGVPHLHLGVHYGDPNAYAPVRG